MNFKTYLTQLGRTPKTAENYSRAITGAMSKWTMENNLTTDSIDNVHSIHELIKIADGLNELPIYQERNTIGNYMYSCALKAFIEYRKSESSEELEQDISDIIEDKTIAETEKSTYINTRIGQEKYRRELIEHKIRDYYRAL